MLRTTTAICAAFALLTLAIPVAAQQSPLAAAEESIKRVPLQRFEVPETSYETVIGIAELAPNASIGRHWHPGIESGYVIEGGFELLIDGQPPRQLTVGDSYQIPPRTVHDAKSGFGGGKVIATYVVEKGQPLASPAE